MDTVAGYTPDADFIDATGQHQKGREAIEKRITGLLSQNPGIRVRITPTSTRFLRRNVAVIDGTWAHLEDASQGIPKEGPLHPRSRKERRAVVQRLRPLHGPLCAA